MSHSNTLGYRRYLRNLVDSLRGTPTFLGDEDDVPEHFAHGREWEAEARGRYEFQRDVDVVIPGLLIHSTFPHIGCSPDGLIGNDGGLEIKCHKSIKEFLNVSRSRKVPSQYVAQVQGCLWVTGRSWWDFVSFFKNDDAEVVLIEIVRVTPDPWFHAKLERACERFWANANKMARINV